MAITDHHAVFIGTTDDGHTFTVVNSPLRTAHTILTSGGFTTREHHGRALHLLPPAPSPEVGDHAEVALHLLYALTTDVADLRSSTRWQEPEAEAAAHFAFADGRTAATVTTDAARSVLELHGFQPTPTGYALPAGTGERERVTAVLNADIHLWSLGHGCAIDLNLPTPEAIPPAPGHGPTPAPKPPAPPRPPHRHTR
ncbi:hypothetical protein ACFU99_13965 [Streptomyces sp. NPDC057654]|uniref:hypothetical protein n=1 Tax=Streptomyces sp. NPDC057654 TaxID=3346196 RepID=UPI0036A36769